MLQRWTLWTLLALCLTACSTPYRPPVMVKGSHDFPGLVDQIDPARTLDIVLVHGMCTHDRTWAYGAMNEVLKAIGTNIKPSPEPAQIDKRAVPKIDVVTGEDRVNNLRFTALVWSPLTAPLKEQLLFDMTGTPTDCATADECKPIRAKYNGQLKDKLLNDCLADALAFEGSRPFIREAMVAELSQVLAKLDSSGPLVVVSDSLGSKLVFDALSDMLESSSSAPTRDVGKKAASRMGLVFMNANQLPILGLAEKSVGSPRDVRAEAAAAAGDPLLRYLAARRQHGLAGLRVVAFTDPNDLLSYRLLPSRYAGENVLFTDVLVSNEKTILGLFSRPDTVHLDYSTNPDVARFIACGPEKEKKNPRCK